VKVKEEKKENEPRDEDDYDDMSCYPGEDGEEYIDGDTTEDEPLVEHQQNPVLNIDKEFPLIIDCHSSNQTNKTDNFSPPIKKRKTNHVARIPSPENSLNDIDSILASPFCDRERLITSSSSEFLPRALSFYAIQVDDFSTDDNFLELNSINTINFPEFGGESLIETTYQLSYDEVASRTTTTRDPLENDNLTPNSWNFTESSWYDISRFDGLAQGSVCNGWWVE